MGKEIASIANAPVEIAGVFQSSNVSSPQLTLIKYLNCAQCLLYNISHSCTGQENMSSQCRVRNLGYLTNLFMAKIVEPSSDLNIGMSCLLKGVLPEDLRPMQNDSCTYFLKFVTIYQGWKTLALGPADPCWNIKREKASGDDLSLSFSGA